jgi:hypothetical protein
VQARATVEEVALPLLASPSTVWPTLPPCLPACLPPCLPAGRPQPAAVVFTGSSCDSHRAPVACRLPPAACRRRRRWLRSRQGSAQAEVALRVIKDGVSLGGLPALMQQLLAPPHRAPSPWGEPLLHVWQQLLNLRAPALIVNPMMAGTTTAEAGGGGVGVRVVRVLVEALEPMLAQHAASLKYCNVLFSLVKHCGPSLLAPAAAAAAGGGGLGGDAVDTVLLADVVERVLQGCTSFVRKPALAGLRRLRQQASAAQRQQQQQRAVQ